METCFKKTLFIASYAPPAIGGGPQVMHTLLKDLPVSSYSVLTSFYHIDNISAQKGNWLPGEYIFYDNPHITREDAQNQLADRSATRTRDWVARLKSAIRRLPVVANLTGMPVAIGQILAIYRRGVVAIAHKHIELLVGVSDYGPALISTYWLHRTTKLPLYLIMFDIYKGNYFFYPGGQLLARIFEPKLFVAATKIMVNNQGTKDFYQQRYGDAIANKISIIHNPVDPGPYLEQQASYQPRSPYRILFTGRIYWPQIRSLKNLIRAVDGITDLDIQLDIYAPHPPKYIESIGITSPKIKLDMASPNEMPQIQNQADILFLPLSAGTRHPDIINTATPGKLTDYLIAGRPILVHSPASSYLAQYARARDFAAVVENEDINELQQAIRKLVQNPDLARRFIRNAKDTFFANHTAKRNISAFHNFLRNE